MAELAEGDSLTVRAIWQAQEAAQDRSERTYLGASVLGDECSRRLWYAFRWAHEAEVFDGRKLSIFATGDVWEDRLVAYLRAAGIEVNAIDPDTGEQYVISFAGGHAGGHTDGQAHNVPEAPKTDHLLEAKSHNDKSFKALKKNGVAAAKPMHLAQMQIYMHERHLTRALYIAVNKNDDEIYTERVEYDRAAGLQLVAKAERIVTSAEPPVRAFEDPTSKMAWVCNYCPARGLCHEQAFARRNCRTCLHATPEMSGDGRWSCARLNKDLTKDEQKAGCPHHLFIPGLVPGEQIDADEAAETVTYRLFNGETFVDGLAERVTA